MIGIIKNNYIFEFKGIDDLAYALSNFVEKLTGDTRFAITNNSYRIVGVADGSDFILAPDIVEEDMYYVFGLDKNNAGFSRGDEVNVDSIENVYKFYFVNYKVPKRLDL